ncbi:unnamed protein product [Acanthoscelides obtectus]|uniref:Uncharacterized protein n=1 Tax=Acanthoscelides obtectus TaxID=200917 RepID=A0A9P0L5U8_ACAOB|nr:unnamed protein product [Acanthoscelides obtectus]CAK1626564.1 Protein-L-isoaspartate O-methyltransferase domain-containing protein 1 [Acanthoscelides obtectus]
MGGVASTSKNNDDLIDNLLAADYIKTPTIERVFRAVDRGEYFLHDSSNAYKDIAWKSGNLHLSAPCIYSEVMEALCLEPGLSFLNLGSGTGYLSTMVGLVLGIYGVNHGIEYHADVVQYANRKQDEFKKYSGAIDEFDYCEPKFIQGNCLCLSSDCFMRYDRVYCSAACPEQYEAYMKNLLKVGGILVMPLHDQLLQVKRKSESNWVTKNLLPVSFASIIQPPEGCTDLVSIIEVEPPSLQSLSRSLIRINLRKTITVTPPVKRPRKVKGVLRRMVVPIVESEDSTDDEKAVIIEYYPSGSEPEQKDEKMDTVHEETTAESSDGKSTKSEGKVEVETKAVIEHNSSTTNNGGTNNGSGSSTDGKTDKTVKPSTSSNCRRRRSLESNDSREDERQESSGAISDIEGVFVDLVNVLRGERREDRRDRREDRQERQVNNEDEDDDSNDREDSEHSKRGPTGDGREGKKKKKRVKIFGTVGSGFIGVDQEQHSDDVSSTDSDSDSNPNQDKRKKRFLSEDARSRMFNPARVVTQLLHYSSSDNEKEEEQKISTSQFSRKRSVHDRQTETILFCQEFRFLF